MRWAVVLRMRKVTSTKCRIAVRATVGAAVGTDCVRGGYGPSRLLTHSAAFLARARIARSEPAESYQDDGDGERHELRMARGVVAGRWLLHQSIPQIDEVASGRKNETRHRAVCEQLIFAVHDASFCCADAAARAGNLALRSDQARLRRDGASERNL